MLKPDRGFGNRTNVSEFEDKFRVIDAFRTHKYQQFGVKEIDLTSALSDEEIPIEANGIFIKYPVDADIRVNDIRAPKISCLHYRYIGGYVHKIYVTSPVQSPKLELLTGVNSELGFLSNNHFLGTDITGSSSTGGFTSYLDWECLAYISKHIIIKNTGATYNFYYKVYGYLGSNAVEVKSGTIMPGEFKQIIVTEMYEKLQVVIARDGTASTFTISYAGSTVNGGNASNSEEELFSITNETTSHTVTGKPYNTLEYRFAELMLSCTSLTGTTPTLDVKVQTYNTKAAVWHDIATFEQLAAAGTQAINLSEGLGKFIRAVYTTGGTVTDCDFKLGVVLKR